MHHCFLSSRLFRALCFLSLATVVTAAIRFDIPAQSASSALRLFGQQAAVEVVFPSGELRKIQAREVRGEFEPAAAIEQLLADTGYVAKLTSPSSFAVAKAAIPGTGALEGEVRESQSGRSVMGANVAVAGTDLSVLTDKRGRFSFADIPAGAQVLHVTAEGMQNTRVTDIIIEAGHRLTLSPIALPVVAASGPLVLDDYIVSAKKNDGVIELERYEVNGERAKPFTGANVDIPRTVNDAQPYYIFDAQTIDRSGAINVEQFLKERLTMNTTAQSHSQQYAGQNTLGNTSSINLRGLGTDHTLILVNGRRMPNVTTVDPGNGATAGSDSQPDLNGIPLNAIERIEILPSSASGIYGGSAIGGVVNVILKKDYAGGEVRVTYDNIWNLDAPTRTVSASWGRALEGGRTHLTLSASWSDSKPLQFGDRRFLYDRAFGTILKNYGPSYLYADFAPPVSTTSNVGSYFAGDLVLKDGTSLHSTITSIPAGTSPSTSAATLYAGLLANAGKFNLETPATPQGWLTQMGASPANKSIMASFSRQMLPNLELFIDASYNSNRSSQISSPYGNGFLHVPASAPSNPFQQNVNVSAPSMVAPEYNTVSTNRIFTVGLIAKPLGSWTAETDFTWSENRYSYRWFGSDGIDQDIANGTLNPFVDALLYPLDLEKYLFPTSYSGSSELRDLSIRASGPLMTLPWGAPTLTAGLERREAVTPENVYVVVFPFTPTANRRLTTFERTQETYSGYGEFQIPLAPPDRFPLIKMLELQLSGRAERYKVDSGTPYYFEYPNSPGDSYYGTPTINGAPFRSKTTYTSTNTTVGLKYRPGSEVIVRVSYASAFLPPLPTQLVKNPLPNPFQSTITDPKSGTRYSVETISGGNPGLKPQNSDSLNAGVIWEPEHGRLVGLRLDAEYYKIVQHDAISSLGVQQIVNQENVYADRVTRNAQGAITLVDTSAVNLFKLETEGWDLSADYNLKTSVGNFNLHAVESIILHLKTQYDIGLPEYDGVNFPVEGGAAKYKANVTVDWEHGHWAVSWTARYFSSYKQYGAAGGPVSTQYFDGAEFRPEDGNDILQIQGSDTIPSQTYHDFFASFTFGEAGTSSLSKLAKLGNRLADGLSLQIGVRNIFNKVPPFDAGFPGYYISPYGDYKLRSYWISLKKSF